MLEEQLRELLAERDEGSQKCESTSFNYDFSENNLFKLAQREWFYERI
jgi:hypothetical protein